MQINSLKNKNVRKYLILAILTVVILTSVVFFILFLEQKNVSEQVLIKYNVLNLVMTIDKNENCKIIDAIYQKNKDTYYTQLHLPKTVLTAGEYIDIMSRL